MTILQIVIVLAYAILSTLEFASFLSRLAGKVAKIPVTGYAQQNIIVMISRFGNLLLMPTLGYVVDIKISKSSYLVTCILAVLVAFILSLFVYLKQETIVNRMLYFLHSSETYQHKSRRLFMKSILIPSSFVYFAYGMAFFISYFVALIFPDYRATLGNSAIVFNGAATILLSLYIEPRVSRIIDLDNDEKTENAINSLLVGRLIALGVYSPILIFSAFLFLL